MVSPSAKQRAVKAVIETGAGTTAEACRALGLARSSYYRNSTASVPEHLRSDNSGRATPSLRPEQLTKTSNQWQNSTYECPAIWVRSGRVTPCAPVPDAWMSGGQRTARPTTLIPVAAGVSRLKLLPAK